MSSASIHSLPQGWRSWDVSKLESEIRGHNQRYWDDQSPSISDYDYDRLVERLRELDPEATLLDHLGPSMVNSVGETVTHAAPMLSLDKCYQEDGLMKWAEKFDGSVIMTPKIDGVACSLRYNARGELYLAATRGDGRQGESITPNVTPMKSVPQKIPAQGVEVEVRGGVYLPLSAFALLTERFSNPRNAAAGVLKRKDQSQTAQIGLKFFAYDLFGVDRELASERLDLARTWGFDPVPHEVLERDQLQQGYEGYVARRDLLDYEIDGVVYRAERSSEYDRLGATAHHPRGAIAYKLQGESARTILKSVEWGVSRNSILTPVGIVKPVKLSGAMVTRITLHHWGMVQAKELSVGAEVIAMRRGGVIPHLETVVTPGDEPVCAPTQCPQCPKLKAPTLVEGDVLYCAYEGVCEPQAAAILRYWVSVTKIEGFGNVWLDILTREGILQTPVDLYTLKARDVLHLDKVGKVRAEKWLESIDQARELPLATFLRALGIQDLGRSASQAIADHYLSLTQVRAAQAEEIASLENFGELTAAHITQGLHNRSELIDTLLTHINVVDAMPAPKSDAPLPLSDQSFVFTGTLVKMKRADAQKLVKELGGSTPSSVSAKLSYLVIGDEGKAGSKKSKAEKLNVPILSEGEFFKLIESSHAHEEDRDEEVDALIQDDEDYEADRSAEVERAQAQVSESESHSESESQSEDERASRLKSKSIRPQEETPDTSEMEQGSLFEDLG